MMGVVSSSSVTSREAAAVCFDDLLKAERREGERERERCAEESGVVVMGAAFLFFLYFGFSF